MTGRDRQRLAWIDELRFAAFCAIALLHVSWIRSTTIGGYDYVVFATRFAVPVFFMIAGYLIGSKPRGTADGDAATRRRVIPVFLFWEAVYVVVDILSHGALRPLPELHLADLLRFALVTLYDGGAAFHLWFLVWFVVSVTIFLDLRRTGPLTAWTVALVLFAVGQALGPWGAVTGLLKFAAPLTAEPLTYTARNGPFFGPLFLMIGAAFASREPRLSLPFSIGLLVAGYALSVVEGLAIAARGSRFVSIWDVTFGTPIAAIGVFGIARALRGTASTSRVAALGRISLGLYCVHALFVELWNAWFPPQSRAEIPITWSFAAAVAIVAASTLTTLAMARVPWLRRFVV